MCSLYLPYCWEPVGSVGTLFGSVEHRGIGQFVEHALAALLGIERFRLADEDRDHAAIGQCFLDEFAGCSAAE